MSRFNTYFLLKEEDIPDYIREKLNFFSRNTTISVKEIGDGNLNYVFRAVEEETGKSIIVKQAGEQLRISTDMRITTDRNRIESEILIIQGKYAPNLVPKVFTYDTVMCTCLMEDLSDYMLMRYALIEHKIFPKFAEDITTYMVNTLLNTSDVVMEHKEKKKLVKSFINPELCEITEDLIYTEPYNDCKGRNIITSGNLEFVKKELYNDKVLHLEIAKLKFNFMNNAQALLHGDLHTGSIFVKSDATRIFDPEFAFFGPMGYDIGNVIANLFFAWDNGAAIGNTSFCDWILQTVGEVIDLFKSKFIVEFRKKATDVMAKTKGFAEYYLDSIIADTAAGTGTELIRRIVGMAQVKDVTTISDKKKRLRAERINILCAKDLIMNRNKYRTGADFTDSFHRAIVAADKTL